MILPVTSRSVICREVPEGAILFCTASEIYFSLNQVGVRIWRLMPPACANLDELVDRLRREFPEATVDDIRRDAIHLLDELASNGLVESAPPV